jgi:Ca2+/Na+ antiporter
MNTISPDNFHQLMAALHGFTGVVIFITALLQFLMQKGGRVHRIIGRIYFYAWPVIIATGCFIGSLIIVAIVVMGFYLCITGVRIAQRKGKRFQVFDKIILIVAIAIVLFMIACAIIFIKNGENGMAIITSFFALLYSFVLTLDIAANIIHKPIFKPTAISKSWYLQHLRRMNLSFLTAVGAFAGVQNLFGRTELNFILPAVIGFVLVRKSVNHYAEKLKLK